MLIEIRGTLKSALMSSLILKLIKKPWSLLCSSLSYFLSTPKGGEWVPSNFRTGVTYLEAVGSLGEFLSDFFLDFG